LPETIAQVALRAPKPKEPLDPHEEVMRAIATTEGKMLTEISDLREAEEERQAERQKLFETQLKKELREIVLREVRSMPPPPPPIPKSADAGGPALPSADPEIND